MRECSLTLTSDPHSKTRSTARRETEQRILDAAEQVFAEFGFRGATMGQIAARADLPKANLHYYFDTKLTLYRLVVERIFRIWLQAADTFDDCDEPREALSRYIRAKMDISRRFPNGSKVWANEILQQAPVIQDYLETTLEDWTNSRIEVLNRWISEGRIRAIDGRTLLYMIWATTQHYADFNHQIHTLNKGDMLSDAQFDLAKETVVSIILQGVGIAPEPMGEAS
ncbi:TetR family transcriptional regulator C-terminal domain-containing protein [Roseibium sp. CAU 1637]|uniref:TetR family transcriptional regulator C-terminal domain-containing protein n=1 Tax=Roseibium limicola TaxID=2816037 RepID=A0A939ENA0_9HYPH|nr:TetR family transcriptional regulator C-terminal domain-containing protein [Roseibium limicola]